MNISKKLNILIADDHKWTRMGLRSAICQETSHYEIIAEAENGEEAVNLARSLHPDIILMDVRMPKISGIEATQIIKKENPGIVVIMLTSFGNGEDVFAALSAGANAYCMKDISTERLLQVFQAVEKGDIWLDSAIAHKLVTTLPTPSNSQPRDKQEYTYNLTVRELEVIKLVAKGHSNKQIAEALKIAERTVKAHISNIMMKLSASDRTQAVVTAVQEGAISLDQLE